MRETQLSNRPPVAAVKNSTQRDSRYLRDLNTWLQSLLTSDQLMNDLVLSVRDPQPLPPGEAALVGTFTATAESGLGDASMTGAFKGHIRPVPRTVRQWPHHLSVALSATASVSFTR